MRSAASSARTQAPRLLKKSGYTSDEARAIATRLGWNAYRHELPIFRDEAQEMGFKVMNDPETMSVYKELVSARLDEQFPRHIIDEFYPALVTNSLPSPISPIEVAKDARN
jgi:hypothetical protein